MTPSLSRVLCTRILGCLCFGGRIATNLGRQGSETIKKEVASQGRTKSHPSSFLRAVTHLWWNVRYMIPSVALNGRVDVDVMLSRRICLFWGRSLFPMRASALQLRDRPWINFAPAASGGVDASPHFQLFHQSQIIPFFYIYKIKK